MDFSELEKIIGYTFNDKNLLMKALTHPSYNRLEFLGDSVISLAITNYFFKTHPNLDEGQLTDLRSANVSTEKFARVALRLRLFQFLKHNCPDLDQRVKEFEDSVNQEKGLVVHGGLVQAVDILADIVESVAAAIYIDIDYDLDGFWKIIGKLLEPIFTPEDLENNPHPVIQLQSICDKNKKKLEFRNKRNDSKSIVSVHVDGVFIASASANKQDAARLNAARQALENELIANIEEIDPLDAISESLGTEHAKQKLQEVCDKKRWPLPDYSIVKETGPPHDKRFVCGVLIQNFHIEILGDEGQTKRESEKSAALFMIRALKDKKN